MMAAAAARREILEQRLYFFPNHTMMMTWMNYIKNDDVVIATPQFQQALHVFQTHMRQLNEDYYSKLFQIRRHNNDAEGHDVNDNVDVHNYYDHDGQQPQTSSSISIIINEYLHALTPHQIQLTNLYYTLAIDYAFHHWTFSYYKNDDPQRQWMLKPLFLPHLFSSHLRLQQAWNAYSDFYKSHTAEMDLTNQNGFNYQPFRNLLLHVKQLQDTLYAEYQNAYEDYTLTSTSPPGTPSY